MREKKREKKRREKRDNRTPVLASNMVQMICIYMKVIIN